MNETTVTETTNISSQDGAVTVSMVVAASTNNVIGKSNQLVWHLPNDLRFFKNTTWGFPVIMGRKTFEVLNKPLPGRTNIVITRKQDWKAPGVITALNLQEAIDKASETNARQIFIIGGGEIYKQSMVVADTIYLTRVHAVMDGDAFFPIIEESEWDLISNDDYPADEQHAYAFSFQLWRKK